MGMTRDAAWEDTLRRVMVEEYGPVRAVISRVVTSEESFSFEIYGKSVDGIQGEVEKALEICRQHMVVYNRRVRGVQNRHAARVERRLAVKAAELRAVEEQIAALRHEHGLDGGEDAPSIEDPGAIERAE